jgi:hypothetical protein
MSRESNEMKLVTVAGSVGLEDKWYSATRQRTNVVCVSVCCFDSVVLATESRVEFVSRL